MTDEVKSPCVRVCKFNPDGHCLGCFRHQDEINTWIKMSVDEKRSVIEKTSGRRDQYWDDFTKNKND